MRIALACIRSRFCRRLRVVSIPSWLDKMVLPRPLDSCLRIVGANRLDSLVCTVSSDFFSEARSRAKAAALIFFNLSSWSGLISSRMCAKLHLSDGLGK